MEKRTLPAYEFRAGHVDGSKTVSGYAARYGVLSNPIAVKGGVTFRERIAAGAFDRILRTKPDVVATLNHSLDTVLGRTTSGTLRLSSDDHGLRFSCSMPNTTAGRDVYESVKRGDINGCSFAFTSGPGMDEWDEEEEGDREFLNGARGKFFPEKYTVRTLKDFNQLIDISLVTQPAYPGTEVDARGTVLAAEVRSRFESLAAPVVRDDSYRQRWDRWKAEMRDLGLPTTACLEDLIDAQRTIIKRRRDILEIF